MRRKEELVGVVEVAWALLQPSVVQVLQEVQVVRVDEDLKLSAADHLRHGRCKHNPHDVRDDYPCEYVGVVPSPELHAVQGPGAGVLEVQQVE